MIRHTASLKETAGEIIFEMTEYVAMAAALKHDGRCTIEAWEDVFIRDIVDRVRAALRRRKQGG